MALKTFFEICEEFFAHKHPNVYDNDIEIINEEEEEEEHCLQKFVNSCVIKLIILFGCEKSSTEDNELKYHVY
jgi:hypothetical protein